MSSHLGEAPARMGDPHAVMAAARVAVPPEEVEAALARVLRSYPVRLSRRTTDFLTFTVTEALAGRGPQLKERTVAMGALGRTTRFDPRVDPGVRVQARRVRDALDRYYAGPGATDPVRIELPRGGYAPVFRRNDRPATGAGTYQRPTAGPSIAVVSLTNLTPGGDRDYLATGISETLVAELSRFPGCRVIGPVTPRAGGEGDPVAVGKRHDARFVLLGSTRMSGEMLRVSVRLVDTASGETTWSRVFDCSLAEGGAFDIEDGIVTNVSGALADYRGVIHLEAVPGTGRTGDAVVHDAIHRYYGYLGDTDAAQFLPTVRALEEAARHEPDNSLVLSMLAGMNLVGHIDGVGGLDLPLERAEDLAGRAALIDPANPHAVAALAWLALVQGRIEACHDALERLLLMCPNHPTFLYRAGFVFAVTGQWDRGVDLIRASIRLNANHPGYLHFFPAMDLCLRGDDAAALELGYRVDTPGGHLGPLSRLVPLARLGRADEARAELGALRAVVPGFDQDRAGALQRMLMPGPVRSMILAALDAIDAVQMHSRGAARRRAVGGRRRQTPGELGTRGSAHSGTST